MSSTPMPSKFLSFTLSPDAVGWVLSRRAFASCSQETTVEEEGWETVGSFRAAGSETFTVSALFTGAALNAFSVATKAHDFVWLEGAGAGAGAGVLVVDIDSHTAETEVVSEPDREVSTFSGFGGAARTAAAGSSFFSVSVTVSCAANAAAHLGATANATSSSSASPRSTCPEATSILTLNPFFFFFESLGFEVEGLVELLLSLSSSARLAATAAARSSATRIANCNAFPVSACPSRSASAAGTSPFAFLANGLAPASSKTSTHPTEETHAA
mmetsp:Transcript_2285/g.8788  ORF Transcript_2285/g.8788 Transcript_2285/m.8788 type:complete len:272 (+) Transcript_2285:221-1036(+)